MDTIPSPLVSCLCVTEGRSAFMPWLLWCFDRQTWPHRELVIVDSSRKSFQMVGRDDVRVVSVPPGTWVGRKRNVALQAAHGAILTWFDDDDWQHPHKLACLVAALHHGASYAGACRGWFVDLVGGRCAPYRGPKGGIVLNSAGFRREAVLPLRFREDLVRASDTHWMREVAARCSGKATLLERDDMFFWLCHDQNLSNLAKKRRFPDPWTSSRSALVRRRGAIRTMHWTPCGGGYTLRRGPGLETVTRGMAPPSAYQHPISSLGMSRVAIMMLLSAHKAIPL